MNAPISQRRRVPVAVVAAIASASLAMAIPSLQHDAQGHEEGHASAGVNAKQLALHDGMRKLWEDHITWTRLFIVSAVDELPDAQATTERLLQNQKHIGNAIKPFYGKAAGNQLTALLREHILVAADLLGAAKAGDQDEVDEQSALWYRNGRQIAGFLHKANPDNWHRKEMRTMMRDHLDLTLDEAVAHLTRDHDADIAAYDKIHRQILHMADMLSDGIVAQFPDRF
jgi:hypothetical protein